MKSIAEILDLEMRSQVTVDSPYYRVYNKLLDAGTRAFDSQDFNRSQDYFEQILGLFPLNKTAQKYKLRITFKLDPQKFRSALDENVRRAKDMLAQGQNKAAKDQFLTVKEILPEYPGIDDLIAQCVVKPKVDENELAKLYNQGISLYEQGRYPEAVAEWRKVVELDNSPDSNPYFARAFLNMDKTIRKINAAQGGPITQPQTGGSQGADPEKEKAIKKHYYLGIAYYTDGDYKKAIDEWQKVLLIDRNNAAALANIQKAKKKLEYAK
jgi:tetratricopeptide (TPR) repeat protein